jgi:hypothetical protein
MKTKRVKKKRESRTHVLVTADEARRFGLRRSKGAFTRTVRGQRHYLVPATAAQFRALRERSGRRPRRGTLVELPRKLGMPSTHCRAFPRGKQWLKVDKGQEEPGEEGGAAEAEDPDDDGLRELSGRANAQAIYERALNPQTMRNYAGGRWQLIVDTIDATRDAYPAVFEDAIAYHRGMRAQLAQAIANFEFQAASAEYAQLERSIRDGHPPSRANIIGILDDIQTRNNTSGRLGLFHRQASLLIMNLIAQPGLKTKRG